MKLRHINNTSSHVLPVKTSKITPDCLYSALDKAGKLLMSGRVRLCFNSLMLPTESKGSPAQQADTVGLDLGPHMYSLYQGITATYERQQSKSYASPTGMHVQDSVVLLQQIRLGSMLCQQACMTWQELGW